MRKLFLVLVLFCISSIGHAAMDLNESNFKEVLKSNEVVLVMVYKHGCHWCDKAFPVVDEFAAANPGVVVAKLDGEKELNLRDQLKIYSGTPTFIKFVKGVEVGGWVGYRDLERMKDEFKNPKPLNRNKPQAQQPLNPQMLGMYLSYLEKFLILNFVLSVIAIIGSFAAVIFSLRRNKS